MDQSSDIKEQVRSQTDIVALIGEAVALTPQRGGREHVCLCPFHDERSPSFNVSPAKGAWYCFGCGEGGDVIGGTPEEFQREVTPERAKWRSLIERFNIKVG